MDSNREPKTWLEIEEMYSYISRMSCVPSGISKLRTNTVIDEDKSVKWNREEVERINKEYNKAVAELNTRKNKLRDEILEEIYYAIQFKVWRKTGTVINRDQSMHIWNETKKMVDNMKRWREIKDWLDVFVTFIINFIILGRWEKNEQH